MRIRRATSLLFHSLSLFFLALQIFGRKMGEKVRELEIFWVAAKLPTNVGRHLIYVEFFTAQSVCNDYGSSLPAICQAARAGKAKRNEMLKFERVALWLRIGLSCC